jgi:hypothetical protein
VEAGGVLGGHGDGVDTGIIGASITVLDGGVLDPGDYLGCTPQTGRLTVDMIGEGGVDIRPGGTFRVQLGGLNFGTPVNGHDQLSLRGTANLNGALDDGSGGGSLDVQVVDGYSVPAGAEYWLIDNDDEEDIDTRFLSLPEGAVLTAGGALLRISYESNEGGNDVTLTQTSDDTIPDEWRLDFDGFHGYTAEGYTGVSPFQWKDGRLFGWVESLPPRWFERNYPVAPPYINADPIIQSEQRLRYDGQATDTLGNPLTFAVDVVAGKQYEVMILTGDAGWNHDKQQFQVYDANVPEVRSTQEISTWGGGAPEGGANIIWGGGTANPAGVTGYYRWVRFTTNAIADGAVADGVGTLLVRMQDLGGGDPATVILGLDIRPVDAVGQLTITRTSGGTDPLEADGYTKDTYSGSGAPPGATLTVTVSAGTQYAIVTPDVDTTMFGGQVTALSDGTFTFSVLRPAKLAGTASPENWTITVEERSGLSRGTLIQPYKTATATKPLRFDFGDYNSPVATGFLQVEPRTTYSGTRGYGWATRVASKTRVDTTPGTDTATALRRDFNYSREGTFKVNLVAGATYFVQMYHANPRNGTTPFVQGAFEVWAEGSRMYTVPSIAAGTTYDLSQSRFMVQVSGDGVLELQFKSQGSFLVSGIDISTGSYAPPAALLAAGNPLDDGAATISVELLQPVAAEAAARWSDMGLTAAQAATLSSVQFAVADLGGPVLGLANPATNQIRIDDDAARLGWSVVSGQRSVVSGQRMNGSPGTTDHGQRTTSGIDLLTVVMHELGHLLGYEHSDDPDDLMAPVLEAGVIRAASGQDSYSPNLYLNLYPNLPRNPSNSRSVLPASSLRPSAAASLGQSAWQDAADQLAADLALDRDEQASQTRVPRQSRLQRYERELDAWFGQLGAELDGGEAERQTVE